jgi:hypothetical protein
MKGTIDEGQTNPDLPDVKSADDDVRSIGSIIAEIMREIGRENLVRPLPSKEASAVSVASGGDHAACACGKCGSIARNVLAVGFQSSRSQPSKVLG